MPFLRDSVQSDYMSAARLERDIVRLISRPGGVQSCWGLGRRVSSAGCAPFDVLLVSLNLLLSLEPHCHLCVLILFVGSSVCVFGIIDMQPFSVLGVEVVGGAEKGNEVDIMAQKMNFGDIEVIPNTRDRQRYLC
jgi:hypothetical protein